MAINTVSGAMAPSIYSNLQANQAAKAHLEAGESSAVETRESTRTQIAEGEAVKPAAATTPTQPGRLSIYA